MYHMNYNTKRKKGKHLSEVERGKIEILLKQKKTKKEIAEEIGVSERTIYREIKRGQVEQRNSDLTTRKEYIAEYAQIKYEEKKGNNQRELKIGSRWDLYRYLVKKMKQEKYSPTAALYAAKKEGYEGLFCVKTLYNYIHGEIFMEYTSQDLPYKKDRRKKKKQEKRIRKKGGRSIEERPQEVNDRKEIGHWEMDTVVGKLGGKKECLLVLTERVSRKQIIRKISDKSSKSVVSELRKISKKYKNTFSKKFKSITTDNGSEFMDAFQMEELGTIVYYAHSYCSWERGSNENANRLIRRFLKKGTEFDKITKKRIQEIEDWINNYPRKLFEGKTSNEIYHKANYGSKKNI